MLKDSDLVTSVILRVQIPGDISSTKADILSPGDIMMDCMGCSAFAG
jgi:hypothetical protein